MFLGLDLGTTNVKAVLTEADGQIIARGSVPVELFHTGDDGVEQDLEEIWAATLSAISAIGAEKDLSTVKPSASRARAGRCRCSMARASRLAG